MGNSSAARSEPVAAGDRALDIDLDLFQKLTSAPAAYARGAFLDVVLRFTDEPRVLARAQLPERKQREEVEELDRAVRTLLAAAVHIAASDGAKSFSFTLDKLVQHKGKYSFTGEMPATNDAMQALPFLQGTVVLMVTADAERLMGQTAPPVITLDEPALPLTAQPDPANEGDAPTGKTVPLTPVTVPKSEQEAFRRYIAPKANAEKVRYSGKGASATLYIVPHGGRHVPHFDVTFESVALEKANHRSPLTEDDYAAAQETHEDAVSFAVRALQAHLTAWVTGDGYRELGRTERGVVKAVYAWAASLLEPPPPADLSDA